MNYTLADGKPINSAEIAKLNAKAAAERAARASVKNAKEQLANAKTARAATAAELSKLTGRPTPAPTRRASVPVTPAKDVLSVYNSLPSGPAKRDFLAKNAVAIQKLAKNL